MFQKFKKTMSSTGQKMKHTSNMLKSQASGVSEADKKKRYQTYKGANNERYLYIETVFKGAEFKAKIVLVVGGGHGIGPALIRLLNENHAAVMTTVPEESKAKFPHGVQVIKGIDPAKASDAQKITKALEWRKVDIVIINEPPTIPTPNAVTCGINGEAAHRMLDLHALAPVNVVGSLLSAGSLKEGSKVVNINSQDASIAWRKVQGEVPFDYSYHMARCAANMAMKLLAIEVKEMGITVVTMHPGFNKTELSAGQEKMYDEEGAVDPEVGAMRTLHEITRINAKKNGKFVNVEDGLGIPW
uniref:Short chain dehydrogenase n=1 Tax=Lotharella oceanica TaxID=641309 RepID=A0A7S2TLN0_9EUKA|mmetsp:Transcript_20033/g.37627  ORF Transcript_20033/g.37627 Transcript_20033/m.37627 type:complete len:301 (+) Transcript_20033:107-1009(+)